MIHRAKLSTIAIGSVLAIAAAGSNCFGQAVPTTNLADASADAVLDRMLKPAGQAPAPLGPIGFPPAITPETSAMTPGPATQPTIREGTYITDRMGQLSKSGNGEQAIFTFDPDAKPIQDPPMIVLPNLNLQMMEQAAAGITKQQRFQVTGMLTQYRNNNYLLIEKVPTAAPSLSIEQIAATLPPVASTMPADASATSTLDRMLNASSRAPKPLRGVHLTDPTDQATLSAVAPFSTQKSTVRENTIIADRTGRLTKSPDGQTAFFTFDADGRAMQDPPAIILPNTKLEMLEQAKQGANRDLRFRITGRLTEYHNRNYLLLDKVVVIPDVVQQF